MTEIDFPRLKLEAIIGFNGGISSSLKVHPDRQHLIYPLGCIVIVEDITTRKQVLLSGHNNDISCLAVSKSGHYLASGQVTYMGFKADIVVWDYEAKKLYCRFTLHKVKVQALSFSPNDKYLLSIGGQDDGCVVIWNIDTKEAICGSPAQAVCAGVTSCCCYFNLSDENFITAGESTIRVWELDIENRKIRPTDIKVGPYKRTVKCIEIDEEDHIFYCGTTSGDIMAIGTKNCFLQQIGPQHQKNMFSLGVTCLKLVKAAETQTVLVGAGDGTLAITKDRQSKFQRTKNQIKLTGAITSISLRGIGHQFFVGTGKSHMYRFNYTEFTADMINTGHCMPVNDIVFPCGTSELFLTCGYEEIRVWHTTTQKELLRITVFNMTCNAIDITNDGKVILSAWNDGKIRAFHPESGKSMFEINDAHNRGVTAIACTSDGQRIISGGGEGQVRVWLLTLGYTQKGSMFKTNLIESMKEHKGYVTLIKVHTNDAMCISVSTDGTCIVWNLENYHRLAVLFENTLFQCACFRPDGCQIITSGTDRKVAYWEVFDGAQIRELEASKSGSVNAMDISMDGSYFITGGDDQLIKVWEYNEGDVTHVGIGHGGIIKRAKICPRTNYVISVAADGAILLWKFPEICKQTPRAEEKNKTD